MDTSLISDQFSLFYDTLSITARLVAALLLGTIVGMERQWRQGTAGLATHALVALGAAAYCALPDILDVSEDVRMGGQVVTGIGFLGAGLIMRDGLSIRGLSTSATVWATGAIGVLAGYGQLFEATEATLLILLINVISPKLNSALTALLPPRKTPEQQYAIELKVAETDEAEIRARILAEIESGKLKFRSIERRSIPGTHLVHLTIDLLDDEEVVASLIRQLSLSPNILACCYKAKL